MIINDITQQDKLDNIFGEEDEEEDTKDNTEPEFQTTPGMDTQTEPEDPPDEPTKKSQPQFTATKGNKANNAFWGYGAVTAYNATNYRSNVDHKQTAKEFKNREKALMIYLRSSAATLLNRPGAFIQLPKIAGNSMPTKWSKPFDGGINEMASKMGFQKGNIVKVCHYSGFARWKGQSLPGGVTIDAGTYKDRRAILPGQRYGATAYNVNYSYRSATVDMGAVQTKKGTRLGQIGGRPHHGSFLITQEWIQSQLTSIYTTVADGKVGSWYDVESYLIGLQKSITDKGGVFQISINNN